MQVYTKWLEEGKNEWIRERISIFLFYFVLSLFANYNQKPTTKCVYVNNKYYF